MSSRGAACPKPPLHIIQPLTKLACPKPASAEEAKAQSKQPIWLGIGLGLGFRWG